MRSTLVVTPSVWPLPCSAYFCFTSIIVYPLPLVRVDKCPSPEENRKGDSKTKQTLQRSLTHSLSLCLSVSLSLSLSFFLSFFLSLFLSFFLSLSLTLSPSPSLSPSLSHCSLSLLLTTSTLSCPTLFVSSTAFGRCTRSTRHPSGPPRRSTSHKTRRTGSASMTTRGTSSRPCSLSSLPGQLTDHF